MAVARLSHLKRVITKAEPGRPITMDWLAERGVTAQLAHQYVASGWLERLGHGFYIRTGDAPLLGKSIAVAMAMGHVGGKTALAWAGFRHNLYVRDRTVLYSHGKAKVADWCAERFPLEMRNRKLFGNGDVLAVEKNADGVPVSEPERAVLEMLSDIPGRQNVDEAGHIMELLHGLRRELMQALLEDCVNIKTVQLFRMLARNAGLPILSDIDFASVPQGSGAPYVIKTGTGTLKI